MKRRDFVFIVLALALSVATFAVASPTAFRLFFHWPDGGVWSNLAASFLLGAPALYAILRKLTTQHAQHLAQLARQHEEHLRTLRQHHEQLIREVRNGPQQAAHRPGRSV